MKQHFKDFLKYRPLLFNLIGRDLKVKYRRSVLGLAWSILNPLFIMLILTQVFGLLMKMQVENYAVYFILGNSMWSLFSESSNACMSSVLSSASLIKKVYIPKYIFPLEKCLFALVNFLFSMIAVIVVMIFQGITPSWSMLLFPVPVLYLLLFCIGVGLILSALTVFFRDIMHLWGVLTTAWMYLTPIIYPMELIEQSGNQIVMVIIQLNPIYHFVTYFRDIMMYGSVPGLSANLICLAWGIGAVLLGLLAFKKMQDKFILHI